MAPDTAIATNPRPARRCAGLRAFAPAAAVRLDAVTKVFGSGKGTIAALDTLSLDVEKGSFTCVVGASGCGKTTLLNLIAGLDEPTSGSIEVTGRSALDVPGVGAVPLAHRCRQHRARAAPPWRRSFRPPGSGARAARPRAPRRLRAEAARTSSPAACASGSRSPALSPRTLTSCSWTSRSARSTRSRATCCTTSSRTVWSQTGLTVVFVTHNVREAARLGDRIVLLASRPGRLAADFDVDLPRPRRIEDSGVTTLATRVTEQLRREVARHGRGH